MDWTDVYDTHTTVNTEQNRLEEGTAGGSGAKSLGDGKELSTIFDVPTVFPTMLSSVCAINIHNQMISPLGCKYSSAEMF